MGTIQAFGFNFAPRGWLPCNGQLLAIAQYQALFSLLGTYYGGDGRTTFALPDLRGRSLINEGQSPGLESFQIGQRGGAYQIALTNDNLPAHNHTVAVSTAAGEESNPQNGFIANHAGGFNEDATSGAYLNTAAVGNAGNGAAFNIRNPYLTVNYCINFDGLYPPRN